MTKKKASTRKTVGDTKDDLSDKSQQTSKTQLDAAEAAMALSQKRVQETITSVEKALLDSCASLTDEINNIVQSQEAIVANIIKEAQGVPEA